MTTLNKDSTERNLGKRRHRCRICDSAGMFQSYLVPEMMLPEGSDFEYFVCDNCGCLQICEIPADLGEYYGSNYYSYATGDSAETTFSSPVISDEKILDVGCGGGLWLLDMANLGYGNLYGCDPFLEQDIRYGDRVWIRNCTIHEFDGDHSFDKIYMKDSFEHVTDPLDVLRSAKRLLKPGGILTVSFPFFPNIAFELFGPHWYQLDAPRHIFLHSKGSLQLLTKASGFAIEDVNYDSSIGSIVTSFFYQFGIRYSEISQQLADEFFSPEQLEEIRQTVINANANGTGDHATFVLRAE